MKKTDESKSPTTDLDMQAQAMLARATGSLSPQSLTLAWMDWASHLAASPGKLTELAQLAMQQASTLSNYSRESMVAANQQQLSPDSQPPALPMPDRRFKDPAWQQFPYNVLQQAFLMNQHWWNTATRDVRGVSTHHADLVNFMSRQLTDTFSPANLLLTNPIATQLTVEERGANLMRGIQNYLDDLNRQRNGLPAPGTEAFQVGQDVALTEGKVVLRTQVMELIQYAPKTGKVHPEPILIIPAWIMKYYILDLSAQNSLIRYLVENGHTVFCISWKNPGEAERDLGMEDYLELGFTAAMNAIAAIVPDQKIHAAGYCLGGTLLAIAAAALVRDGQGDRLASVTLLAAQTDFTEPGEISLFIDDSQVSMLEAEMHQTGYLRADQMAGAFQMLRSYDLLWSRMVQDYLIGERRSLNDLMAWNADATRMPARMHTEYLRHLFLNNELASSRYVVNGSPITLQNVTQPVFCVGTTTDHVAPWTSVYKLHRLCPAEITFVLTSGGHNAGVVNPPENSRRRYQMSVRPAHTVAPEPAAWQASAALHDGSWWTEWLSWLKARSSTPVNPPTMGKPSKGYKPLDNAPGLYVHEK